MDIKIAYRLVDHRRIEATIKAPLGERELIITFQLWDKHQRPKSEFERSYGIAFGKSDFGGIPFLYFLGEDGEDVQKLKSNCSDFLASICPNPVEAYLATQDLSESIQELIRDLSRPLSPKQKHRLCRRSSTYNSPSFETRRQLGKFTKR